MQDKPTATTAGEPSVHSTHSVEALQNSDRTEGESPRSRSHHSDVAPARKQSLGDWWNRTRYGLYAPIYGVGAKPLEPGRRRAIDRLGLQPDDRILILGSGPGLDLNYLPTEASITAIDINQSMVGRTDRRAAALGMDVDARVGDAQDLPFDDSSFDVVLLHLILTVVPDPHAVVGEAARVLADDGRISIYDKFVPPGESPSLLRRAFNPLFRVLVSDLTRRLDPMVEPTNLVLDSRESFVRGLYTVTVARPVSGR